MEIEDDSDSDVIISFCSQDRRDFKATLQGIGENDPHYDVLDERGECDYIDNMTDMSWEQLGKDISNNTHLKEVSLDSCAFNDHNMSFFFRGLTGSNSIEKLSLFDNDFTVAGVRSMVPFLQNSNNLMDLNLGFNNIQSEGFNILLSSLRDSPIRQLQCIGSGIESIEIDNKNKPKHLEILSINNSRINTEGCRGLAKLLEGGDATLAQLFLTRNKIDDEGVDILVNALQSNTTLETLALRGNDGISKQGRIMLLKLVNDISSIKAALQSNHKLRCLDLDTLDADEEIQKHIDQALAINIMAEGNSGAAGRIKVIHTQLHSATRAAFARLQAVNHSLYNEINSLHLPEVLALVGQYHGQREVYIALKSSIAGVISTVNRRHCLLQQKAYHRAKIDAIEAEIAAIEDGEGLVDIRRDSCSDNKRLRI